MRASLASQTDSAAHTLIVGVGNEALRDEGVGVHAARALAGQALPEGVRVIAAGTPGYGLLAELQGAERLVLVDAMEMRLAPATIVTARPEELRCLTPPDRTSLHGTGLFEALDLARALGLLPGDVRIVGVQPAEVTWGLGLSPALQRALPALLEAVLAAALAPRDPACQRKETTGHGHGEEKDPRDR